MLAAGFLGVVFFYLRSTRSSIGSTVVLTSNAQDLITNAPSDHSAMAATEPAALIDPVQLQISPTPENEIYIVIGGDTLIGIANYFEISVDILKQLNELEDDMIIPGQELLVPSPADVEEVLTTVDTQLVEVDRLHTVLAYETVESISNWYGVSSRDIRAANAMLGNAILIGQQLVIPAGSSLAHPVFIYSTWDIASYGETSPTERFTLHYAAGTYPSYDPDIIALIEQSSLDHIERIFEERLSEHYDIYLAGSIFAPPDQGLSGRSYSGDFLYFLLHDGTGNADAQQYLLAKELAPLYMWNVFGPPASTMLREGVAVYTAMKFIEGSNHLPLELFCFALLEEGVLPSVTNTLRFAGQNYDLINSYAAGCFVGFLMETYDADALSAVYPEGNYAVVYGQPLESLEKDWIASLTTFDESRYSIEVDSGELVALTSELMINYHSFMPSFTGSDAHINAYLLLDQARIAVLENQLTDARQLLDAHTSALAGN
jgi:LysM repeat protein